MEIEGRPLDFETKAFDPWPAVNGLLKTYHDLFYQNMIWGSLAYKGLHLLKQPNDLWAYGELIATDEPQVIVECGTYSGASALYFADQMSTHLGRGEVITIDVSEDGRGEPDPSKPSIRPVDNRITYVLGDSADPEIVERVHKMVAGRRAMVVLDSDHDQAHVAKELLAYQDLVQAGQHLVIEDTNVTTAAIAVGDFLEAYPRFERDRMPERFLLTLNPGGWLRATR